MQPNIIHTTNRNKDRWELLKKELENQNITDYKIWFGETHYENARQNIAESHKNIIRYAKEFGLKEVLIWENDIYFPAKGNFQNFIDNKPEKYDMYTAGAYGMNRGFRIGINQIKGFTGLHCYMVHERFYDTFLNIDTSKKDIDAALTGLGEFYIIYPFEAIQHETESDNKKGVIYSNKQLFRNYLVRGFNYNG